MRIAHLRYCVPLITSIVIATAIEPASFAAEKIPDKTVVLTLDDAVKTQIAFVAPLLERLGFKATFFITRNWMDDHANFMTWQDAADLNSRGFEIGNHTWTHSPFDEPENAAKLNLELQKVDDELVKVGVTKPVSFAWPGDNFGPEAIDVLRHHGILLARRGMQPEVPYGEIKVGPLLNVHKNHPLLIPTTGDAYPGWTLDHFKKVVAGAKHGKIVVLQFHGVPDIAHPWVNTPPEMFEQYMQYLKDNGYHVIAMRDLLNYYDVTRPPKDRMLKRRVATVRKK